MCEFVAALLLLAAVPAGGDLAPSERAPWVAITGHRAEVVEQEGGPAIRLGITVRSRLGVPVQSLHVGVLFADSTAAMSKVNAAEAYQGDLSSSSAVGMFMVNMPLMLPPGSEGSATAVHSLALQSLRPRVFQTHLLAYELADLPQAPELLAMLGTEAAADEVAACRAFGLMGDRVTKARARRRWSRSADLRAGLAARATAAPPERISRREMFHRVFSVLALGVLGGPVAQQALASLRASEWLGRFDEPIQLLRIARSTGSPLETPLAFALPAAARDMESLVTAAQSDVEGLSAVSLAAPTPALEPTGVSPSPSEGRRSGSGGACTALGDLCSGFAATLALGALGAVLGARRRRRQGGRSKA